jgi:hypothetical protein
MIDMLRIHFLIIHGRMIKKKYETMMIILINMFIFKTQNLLYYIMVSFLLELIINNLDTIYIKYATFIF